MVRYADDVVVLCVSREEAERALADVRKMLEGKLRLQLHPEKTRILHHTEGSFDFVGFLVHRRYLWPRVKTLVRFKEKVRLATRRQQGRNVQEVIRLLNPVLRGFGNYYRGQMSRACSRSWTGGSRMRVRCFMEKKRAVKHQNRRIPNARAGVNGSGLPRCTLTPNYSVAPCNGATLQESRIREIRPYGLTGGRRPDPHGPPPTLFNFVNWCYCATHQSSNSNPV